MKIRVLTLRYCEGLQGFSEDAIYKASSGYEVLEVRDHYFEHGGVPHLTLVLLLGEGKTSPAQQMIKKEDDPSKELAPELLPLYRNLRQWRNERAKGEGIPSYLILRNVQIAAICRLMPKSLSELKQVDGVGEATCAKYGNDILGLIPENKTGAEVQ